MANITKRNNSYLIRVSCGYDTNGKQIIKSKTWRPAPNMTERQIQKELNRIAIEFETNIEQGNLADTYRIKFSDFCPIYLEIAANTLAPSTLNSYEKYIEHRLIPFFGHMKLKDIRPIHCQKFIQDLGKDTARIDGKNKPLSSSSIQRIFTVMKSIMAKAYKLGYIDKNPTETTRLDIPTIKQPETGIFDKEELSYMLDCLEDEPLQYKLLIHLAIVTGARRGELVALQWDCIDYDRKTITIKQSNYKVTGQAIKTKVPKTSGSIREITIPKYCISILKQHKAAQMTERLQLGSLWQDGNWIFTQWNGKPMYPDTPSLWFRKFQERNNLPHRKFHALRHTSATMLLTDGTNIKTVAARLGHSKITTTNRYVHNITSADEAAANIFDDMFSPKVKA